MWNRHKKEIILILLGLTVGFGGIFGNVASNALPYSWKPYLWISWPLFLILTLTGSFLAIWQMRTESIGLNSVDRPDDSETIQQHGASGETELPKDTQNKLYDKTGVNMISIQELRKLLMRRSNLTDLKDLCFTMNIDYDNYSNGKDDFIRDLLADLDRRDRVDEFVKKIRQEKPWILKD